MYFVGNDENKAVQSIIIRSDNGLSPGRRQAIIWTHVGILFIGPLGTSIWSKFKIILHENALENVVCEMASILSRPQCVNADCGEKCSSWQCLQF